MPSSHTFSGVTPEVLKRLHASNESNYTLDLNVNGASGTITAKSGVGEVVVAFDYVAERAEVALTILNKPTFVPAPLVWAEFSLALRNASVDPSQ
jgi:hypothetical protein